MAAKEFDEQRPGNVETLLHLGVHLRVEIHLSSSDGLQSFADTPCRNDECRKHHERQDRESPLECEHRDDSGHENHRIAHRGAESRGDCTLCTDHVVVQAADEGPGLRAGEEGHGHALHFVEESYPQVVNEAFADAGRAPALHDGKGRFGQRCADGQQRQPPHEPSVAGGDGVVNDRPKDERRDERDQGRGEDGPEKHRNGGAVGPGELPDPSQGFALEFVSFDGFGVARDERVGVHLHLGDDTEGTACKRVT